ncbi:alpha/beta fold hydrolase [Streptomyces griseorubiginosus]|uniref:alpha/beta fold hydrolase n=1 Tax=Streptomyces griseorubiginosus TaxID=67304 RepID=UPI001C64113F|nr:alpha/beta hydrolase [Streptomyces griseorubiginosus]
MSADDDREGSVRVRLRRAAHDDARRPVRVLLLHGLAGSTAVWRQFTERAGGELELWEAELPWAAHGDTRWSHDPDPVPWVARSLDAVPGQIDLLIAHSFAANAVLELLVSRPAGRPGAAVLVSPFHRSTPEEFEWDTAVHYLHGFQRILDEGLRVGSDGRIPVELREAMALRVRDRIGPYGWMRFFDAYLRSPFLDTTAVGLPTLVVGGEHDFAARPADARALAAALPDARLRIFERSGHFPMAEQPELFAEAVHGFLHSLTAASSSHQTRPPTPVPELT